MFRAPAEDYELGSLSPCYLAQQRLYTVNPAVSSPIHSLADTLIVTRAFPKDRAREGG